MVKVSHACPDLSRRVTQNPLSKSVYPALVIDRDEVAFFALGENNIFVGQRGGETVSVVRTIPALPDCGA